MSDYQDIDEWATAIDAYRGGTTTCDAGDGLTLTFRHHCPDGHPRTALGLSDISGAYEWIPLDDDFTRDQLLSEARRLIAEARLYDAEGRKARAMHRMLISRRLVQSARTHADLGRFDSTLSTIIRAGAEAALTRDQMVTILADAYRAVGTQTRPEGWEATLSAGQVDSALAEEPTEQEDLRAAEELRYADAVVSSERGRALMRAVEEAMAQEQATAAAIARRDDAIRAALEAGMTQRQAAQITGLSQQRVGQIGRSTR